MSITKNSEIVVAIVSENGTGAIASVNQFADEPEIAVRRESIPGASATLGAFALLSAALQNLPEGIESAAISMPSSIFPRVKEAFNALEEGLDTDAVKAKVVKAWIRRDDPTMAEAIEEMVDTLASVEVPLVLAKNLNAYRFELNGAEAFAAGIEDGQELTFKNGVTTVGDKAVHVLGSKSYNGTAKVSVRGEAFTRKNGVSEINASVERNDEPDVALENLRATIKAATDSLNRVKKIAVKKSA